MSHPPGRYAGPPRVVGVGRLPSAVRAWVEAHLAHDLPREVSVLTDDVVVAADGQLFLGRAGALDWSRREGGDLHSLRPGSCVTRGDVVLVTLWVQGPTGAGNKEVTYCFLLSGDLIRGLAVAA